MAFYDFQLNTSMFGCFTANGLTSFPRGKAKVLHVNAQVMWEMLNYTFIHGI